MRKTKTFPWDGASHLRTEEDVIACLEAAFEEDDTRVIALALDDICRSEAMATIASEGLHRESLRQAVSANGELEFGAVLNVVRTLGLRLRAEPAAAVPADRDARAEPPGSRLRAT